MNSVVINVRCDVVAVANAASWLNAHVPEAATSLSTVIRSVLELFNERLVESGQARVTSADEALALLNALGLKVKQGQRGRVQLIKQMARENELADFGSVNESAPGANFEELKQQAQDEVRRRLELLKEGA